MSALFRWPCSISIHLSPQVCHCWCLPVSAGHVAFLVICLAGLPLLVSALFRWRCNISIHLSPGLSLLVSALFRWPCSISIHLSRSRPAGVRPFPLKMHSAFVSQVFLLLVSAVTGVRPFPLLVSALFCWPCSMSIHLSPQVCHCWRPPFSTGHVAFLFICLPGLGLSLVVSAPGHGPCSISFHLSPRSVAAGVRPFPLAM